MLNMNTMRMGLFCVLAGCLAADAQAQMGTYGSPDPIPLGQYAPAPQAGQYAPQYAPAPAGQYGPQYVPASAAQYPQPNAYAPAVANRPAYLPADDAAPSMAAAPLPPSPAAIPLPPSTGIPQPPPGGLIPQPPTESSAVSNMLSEPNAPGNGPSPGTVMPPGGYIKEPGNCDNCGSVCGCGDFCLPWYFSAEALYMTRNKPNNLYTSAEQFAVVHQGLFNEFNWTPGAQATLGYRFGGCEWAVEGTYWSLAESDSDGGPGIPGPYVSPFTFGLTNILGTTNGLGGFQTANNYTDGSPDHHTWRDYQAQDVEINFVRNLCGGECNCFGVDFVGGFRWFRFQDGLVWGAQRANDGSAYANDWLYLNDHLNNDLFGGQIGINASYRFADRWKVFVRPMVGAYDDHMSVNYNLYAVSSTTGQQYQGSSQTYTNPNYPVHAVNDGFATLTQVDLGLDWQPTRHFALQFGYRMVAATGIGLADNQVPQFANDTQSIGYVQRNGDLILHGAFAGLTFTW
jgi:hypothetical protein